jgi:hypothetical protein
LPIALIALYAKFRVCCVHHVINGEVPQVGPNPWKYNYCGRTGSTNASLENIVHSPLNFY